MTTQREGGMSEVERMMPLSDIDDLDEVVHELGIQDSHVTPAEAVRELNQEIERLRRNMKELADAADSLLSVTPSERQEPRIWFARVDALKLAVKVARGEK